MIDDRQNMTTEQLVDILAQKTERFTQLMVYKNFGDEYVVCKAAIQQILAEIESRKESINKDAEPGQQVTTIA